MRLLDENELTVRASFVDLSFSLKAAKPCYFSLPVKAGLLILSLAVLPLVSHLVAQDAVPADLITPNESALSSHEVQALQSQPSGAPVAGGQAVAETPRRFNYSLTVSFRGVYDDNINLSSFDPVSDFYFTVEPMLSLGFGGDPSEGANGLTFIYRPSLFLFADHSDHDTVQHLIRLSAQHNFGRLTISLVQDIQILDGVDLNSLSDPTGHNANIDVGQRTRHNIFTTQINDTYDLTGKLFLSNSFGIALDNYPSDFISSQSFTGNLFLNYNYGGKLTVGVGGNIGYTVVEQGNPNQTYEQANIRINYTATAKISLSASVGAEFRQFENDSRGVHVSPVFELTGSYRPFDGTSISIVGSRRVENSASIGGQDYTTTDFHLLISQRFLTRLSLGLAVGYENSDYFSTISGLQANRDDDYYYVQPSVDISIMRFWTAGAYYLYREDSSSLPFYGFDNNQFGIRSTLTF